MRLAIFGQRKAQRFLGSGLADRTGDADHFARQPRPSGGGEVPQSCEHVRHDQQWGIAGKLSAPVDGDYRKRRLGGQCRWNKFMAVAELAADRKKSFARSDAAAIDREAGYRGRKVSLARGAHRVRHCVYGPQRGRGHAASSLRAAATAW